jgi:hypothetical protein
MDYGLGSRISTVILPDDASNSSILSTVRYFCFTNLLLLAPFILPNWLLGKKTSLLHSIPDP